MAMNVSSRPSPAPVKVVCLGLGRTGTSSLRDALEILGLGPCYHFTTAVQRDGEDFAVWSEIGDGNGTPDLFDHILRDHQAVSDYPAAMYGAELLAAYPNSKFILTTRDPAKWEKSMNATILHVYKSLEKMPVKTKLQDIIAKWSKIYCEERYHRGRLYSHTRQELLDHNERVKQNIPAEKLLVYEVSQGWDPLIQFLGVPKPLTPFPHVNRTAQYQEMFFPMYTSSEKTVFDVDGKTVSPEDNLSSNRS